MLLSGKDNIHSMLNKKILKNISWLLFEHGWRIGSNLIIAAILARQLDVARYGIFQYALALIAIFSTISFICGGEVLVPILSNSNEYERKVTLSNAFILRLVFSIIAYVLLFLFSFFTENSQDLYIILILGISILFSESFGVVLAWLQSITNIKPSTILFVLSQTVRTLYIVVLFIINSTNIYYYCIAFVSQPLIYSIGLFYYYFKFNNNRVEIYFDLDYIKILFKKGLPFFGGLIAWFIFCRLDLIVLKNFVTPYELGYYAAATQLVGSIKALSPILVMSMAPILVYRQSNLHIVKKNIVLICCILVSIAIVTALCVQLISPYIVPLLFGKEYIKTISLTIDLSWVMVFIFLESGLNIYLLKIKRGIFISYKWILTLCLAIPLYYLFANNVGVLGIVYGQAICYIFASILGIYFLISKS